MHLLINFLKNELLHNALENLFSVVPLLESVQTRIISSKIIFAFPFLTIYDNFVCYVILHSLSLDYLKFKMLLDLRHPPLDPALPPFSKFFFSLPSLVFRPFLGYFTHFPPSSRASPSCSNPTNQPSLVQTNIKRVILPGSFLDNLE